ncbi:MAG: AbrB/MazE/SpoVT family DNA-binding domain-containing protein [Candidatus Altiarchaeota archaeon]|nr:AbrB/MazE/SpoVT family DNA-binding domain-containing protein [Candidatus Altiarchaeota archaeon]MBU4342290.1 AbrB/MazE/SpoVT family DNA-binding domain-containing protein [Candidatus Altiarchaeota archaeon]
MIAGTTYSVSLPKEWVKRNNLREKNEILLFEKDDRTLVISPHSIDGGKLDNISLNIDEYATNIDQVLFAVYYLGIENISLFSRKELTKDVKARIRKTITHMSGTEISYEDKQKITIKVLLDQSKVDIIQVFYRISLILESSISNVLEDLDINEIRINENEIDRLYHLIAKIVLLSLIDSNVLHSSKIKNVSLVPAYFLISKRLENIGDNINHLSEYLHETKVDFENKKEILGFIKAELNRNIDYVARIPKASKVFEKINADDLRKINNSISKVEDRTIQNYLEYIIRYVVDIEEEIVNISFYNKLIHDNIL